MRFFWDYARSEFSFLKFPGQIDIRWRSDISSSLGGRSAYSPFFGNILNYFGLLMTSRRYCHEFTVGFRILHFFLWNMRKFTPFFFPFFAFLRFKILPSIWRALLFRLDRVVSSGPEARMLLPNSSIPHLWDEGNMRELIDTSFNERFDEA